MIREIRPNDYDGLMKLYTHLHDREPPKALADLDEDGRALWMRILGDRDYHIIVAEEDGVISEVCVTNGQVVEYGTELFRIRR